MYTQFFGNYLISKELITHEQLISALSRQNHEVVHLSTLALYSGCMLPSEIEEITKLQLVEGRKFSELSIEKGYLTKEQVLELLRTDSPNFLVIGQILLRDGIFTYESLNDIFIDYRSSSEFFELEMDDEGNDFINTLIDNFLILSESAINTFGKTYLTLLFNNFIQTIGDDFTALPPTQVQEFSCHNCIKQSVMGNYNLTSYICMGNETALAFAERYAREPFNEVNEYVQACLEDFLNVHNGVFIVNASNNNANELTLGIPQVPEDIVMTFDNPTYYFPVMYPFGTVHFLIELEHIKEVESIYV
uniref:chemotaxis protein CheX n=1 Tax=Agathobacter sp. TaxID=2021311 RepID=UPI004056126B